MTVIKKPVAIIHQFWLKLVALNTIYDWDKKQTKIGQKRELNVEKINKNYEFS